MLFIISSARKQTSFKINIITYKNHKNKKIQVKNKVSFENRTTT